MQDGQYEYGSLSHSGFGLTDDIHTKYSLRDAFLLNCQTLKKKKSKEHTIEGEKRIENRLRRQKLGLGEKVGEDVGEFTLPNRVRAGVTKYLGWVRWRWKWIR